MPRTSRAVALAAILTATAGSTLFTGSPAIAATGTDAPAGAQASVARLHIGEGINARSCSGAVIDDQWVLTAASCFANDPANPGQLAAGKPAFKTIATLGRSALTGTGGHVSEVAQLVPSPDRDLVMARLTTPATGMATVSLTASPASEGDVLKAVGYGRTKTEWLPGAAHTASMKVNSASGTELAVAGAGEGDALCQGDAGAPLLRETEAGTELVAVATRSRQGGCLGETETRTDAAAVRTDDIAEWAATTMGRSWTQLMAAADFNGDGKADVLSIDAKDKSLYVQVGDGAGKFAKPSRVGWGSVGSWANMRLIAAADFTGDGKADILTANLNGNLYLYTGNGKNGISGSSVAASGWNSNRLLTAADVNGDKKADLIAVSNLGKLYTYASNGTTFGGAVEASTGWANMRLLAAGDFNGDGKADVVGIHNGGALYLYTGKGNGTFNGATQTSSGWQNMRLVASTDYNNDGKADLIAVHTSGNIYAYPGNGKGAFGTPVVTQTTSN